MELNYRFGRFEVWPTQRLLFIDGRERTLGARAFDVLLALIERRPQLVTKRELLDLVWPNLFVEENNLQVQVSTLRKLLGAQSLVTVAGQGYRFAMTLDGELQGPVLQVLTKKLMPNLPAPPRKLLGRDSDLTELIALIRTYPLVSIVGAAGVGKTVLALAAAYALHNAPENANVWIDLSAVSDPSLLPVVISHAIGLSVSTSDPSLALLTALESRQLLLVLDNAEHLLEAVAQFAWLVGVNAPGVKLLVTSQAALKVESERVFRLGGLSVPKVGMTAEEANQHGSVRLFTDQAQVADRTFAVTEDNVATVISLCRRLDGLALAIKLAAARLPLLGLNGVESRLRDRLKLLSGLSRGGSHGIVSRRQTLSESLDWSHSLLSSLEQIIFRRCSVFVNGFTLELACVVCGDSTLDKWEVINVLEGLVDRSLVDVEEGVVRRFRLSEYAWEYGRIKLEKAQETEPLHHRHADALATLMDRAYETYWHYADLLWLEAWRVEIDNVQAALDWSLSHQSEVAVRLMGAAGPLFMLLGMTAEGRRRCLAIEPLALSLIAQEFQPRRLELEGLLARYWMERGRLYTGVSHTRMSQFALTAAAHYRAVDDPRGVFLALCCAVQSHVLPVTQAQCILGEIVDLEQTDWPARPRSHRLLAEVSFFRQTNQWGEARFPLESLHWLAVSADLETAKMGALSGLAELSLIEGDYENALHFGRKLISSHRHSGNNFLLQSLAVIVTALLFLGHIHEARKALADFIATSIRRDWEWFGLYSDLFALLAVHEGRTTDAARLLGYAGTACDPVEAKDISVTQVRARSRQIIDRVLEPSLAGRLMSEGARMDRETACALALAGVRTDLAVSS
ncbi:Predicted ATPase [Pseudomonas asplenii]|uniref:Predicted ATPase n=1 Tax=Pseudomonas asplenii TaxID=53407 RepID=A0A1H1VM88_9PSED|nr:winged helix-turn-helix domain-containing protein [Pseudomonas asplenii]SDS85785.1 Predicted ATPase [Pseudomonas asplenii]